VSVHGTGFVGGMKRFVPAVVPPYGMPLKMLMPSLAVPRTRPVAVVAVAVALSASAAESVTHRPACIPVNSSAACLTKVLRLDEPLIFILRARILTRRN
jgi:hypothetical protein